MWKRKWVVGIAILITIIGLWFVPRSRFEVINESGQPIHDLTITVSQRTYRFGNVEPGDSHSAFYTTSQSDSYFDVHGERQDGKPIDYTVEYVEWEEHFQRVVIKIRPNGQAVSERK